MEIHFYEDCYEMPDDADVCVDFSLTTKSIEEKKPIIHTTSMANMSFTLVDKGYDIFLHKNGKSVQIRYGMPEIERELRPVHNIYKIWRSGGFNQCFVDECLD